MQDIAWAISIWLMGLLGAAFIFVIIKSGDAVDATAVQGPAGKIRAILFWLILIVGVPVGMLTLEKLPYSTSADGNIQIVEIEGSQYNWDISPMEIEVGRPVEFHVTSADVTHGFAIYDDTMTLIAQTQAMPEYTNVLTYTFTKPGVYKILCLEYCGMGHHTMSEEITVTSNGGV
ncbi:cupredoxin domain-containing protein [Ghiorsea bivora]|uniref:hypothetical protein n=1 Tax=Ghiorsea bivora TaxID=1485545 RepID=UPI000571CD11|nr:hypothetical protein [Ghiorsea bivora]